MIDALIGYSGFVGGQLLTQHSFGAVFNRSNISEIGKSKFNTVVCAAAPGSMLTANRQPEKDLSQVNALIESLSKIHANQIVLISSIAVLSDFDSQADENTTSFQTQLAYGKHRRMLEAFCEEHFDKCLIVRLPALFGAGLQKNFIFDLLNPTPTFLTSNKYTELQSKLSGVEAALLDKIYKPDISSDMLKLDRMMLAEDENKKSFEASLIRLSFSATHFHNRNSTYQYYDMSRLWADLTVALQSNLKTLHLAMPPLQAADIHKRLLGFDMPETQAKIHNENMHTIHANLWGRNHPSYLDDAESVLSSLEKFFLLESL